MNFSLLFKVSPKSDALCNISQLEEHPLSAFRDCLFAVTLSIPPSLLFKGYRWILPRSIKLTT